MVISNLGSKWSLVNNLMKTVVRGKKKSAMSPSTQKVVNQLSALSASRKQPKVLSLCQEDIIKHRTIVNAWKSYKAKQQHIKRVQLQKQFVSIQNAMEDLKVTSPELYELANKQETKRWPLQMRVPTDFPANKPWVYNYAPDGKK